MKNLFHDGSFEGKEENDEKYFCHRSLIIITSNDKKVVVLICSAFSYWYRLRGKKPRDLHNITHCFDKQSSFSTTIKSETLHHNNPSKVSPVVDALSHLFSSIFIFNSDVTTTFGCWTKKKRKKKLFHSNFQGKIIFTINVCWMRKKVFIHNFANFFSGKQFFFYFLTNNAEEMSY